MKPGLFKYIFISLFSPHSLICIKRVIKLLMSSMVLPWDENAERNDVQSRLSFLSLDSDIEVKDVDLPAISAVVDNLLIKDAPQLQNYKNVRI